MDDTIVASLKLKIDELNQEVSVSKAELDAAHEQLNRLQDRYDSLQRDMNQRSQELKKRLTSALEVREKEIRAEMLAQETAKLEEAAARHRDELARKEQAQKTMIEILEDKLVEVRLSFYRAHLLYRLHSPSVVFFIVVLVVIFIDLPSSFRLWPKVRAELDAAKEANRAREVVDRSPDLHNVSSNGEVAGKQIEKKDII